MLFFYQQYYKLRLAVFICDISRKRLGLSRRRSSKYKSLAWVGTSRRKEEEEDDDERTGEEDLKVDILLLPATSCWSVGMGSMLQ